MRECAGIPSSRFPALLGVALYCAIFSNRVNCEANEVRAVDQLPLVGSVSQIDSNDLRQSEWQNPNEAVELSKHVRPLVTWQRWTGFDEAESRLRIQSPESDSRTTTTSLVEQPPQRNLALLSKLFGWGIIFVLLIALAYMLIVPRVVLSRRTEEMKSLARELGMQFLGHADDQLVARIKMFGLFHLGERSQIVNLLRSETDTARISIFDYVIVRERRFNTTIPWHTVLVVESESISIPRFSLRPIDVTSVSDYVLQYPEIPLSEKSHFAQTLVLRGRDAIAIKGVFDSALLELCSGGDVVEAAREVLILSRPGGVKVSQLKELVAKSAAIHATLKKRCSVT